MALLKVTVLAPDGEVTLESTITESTLASFAATGIKMLLQPGGSITIEHADADA